MARIRTIKPDFFTSESISALPLSARLTFIGLWTHVDDEFRCVDNVKLIRAAIWPLDDVTLGEVEKDIDELVSHGMVVRYVANGRNYLHVPGMGTHQRVNRATPSKLPPPPTEGEARQTHDTLTENSVKTHDTLTEDSPPERKGKEGKGRELEPRGVRTVASPTKQDHQDDPKPKTAPTEDPYEDMPNWIRKTKGLPLKPVEGSLAEARAALAAQRAAEAGEKGTEAS